MDSNKLRGTLSQSFVHILSILSAGSCQSCFRRDKPGDGEQLHGSPDTALASEPWNLWEDELLTDKSSPFAPLRGEGAGMRGSSRLAAQASRLLIPIEDVPLGARIPTKNPKPWEFDDSLPEPDEQTWSKISITVQRIDGGFIDAELLRPNSWIQANGVVAGQALPMHIEELQVDGLATITAIDACPALSSGEGSAVTGRFITRRVDEIARIEVLGADGQIETIEGTTIHPIWSLDRNDWVPLGELQEGERLLSGLTCPASVSGIGIEGQGQAAIVITHSIHHRATPVYNIEVHGQHVYQVGELALLVHNACNLNSNNAISNFGIYRIKINGVIWKVGKADLNRITKSSGLPTRLHQQVRKLEKVCREASYDAGDFRPL